MPKVSPSPRSQQRLRVFDTYRGRGHRTNPLWLVYSIKAGRDLILPSDCHLVHWLVFLETCTNVNSFEHAGDGNEQAGRPVHVNNRNGTSELHYVQSANAGVSQSLLAESLYPLKTFNENNLRSFVPSAMRWLKAIAFASALRDKNVAPARRALAQLFSISEVGNVDDLIRDMHGFDTPVVVGLLVQLAIEGVVSLDLSSQGLNGQSRWVRTEESNVVA